MSIAKDKKQDIMKAVSRGERDTGSPEVQVAIQTERIKEITEHRKTHKKDKHSLRGLIRLVNGRRKMLDYLRRRNLERYEQLIKKLGLRR